MARDERDDGWLRLPITSTVGGRGRRRPVLGRGTWLSVGYWDPLQAPEVRRMRDEVKRGCVMPGYGKDRHERKQGISLGVYGQH